MSSDSALPDFDDEGYRRKIGYYQYDYYVPMMWALLAITFLTLITTYAFPQQRKFPACVASWSVMLSMVKAIRELVKWGPYSGLHYYLVWHPTPKMCAAGFAADMFFDSGFSINNLILTSIIYLSARKGIDMSKKITVGEISVDWHKLAIIVFWIYTGCWAIAAANLKGFTPTPPICPAVTNGGEYNLAFIVFYFLFIVLEIFLIGSSAKYIYSVFKQADGMMIGPNASKSNDVRLLVTTVRFLCIIVLQTVPGLLFQSYYLLALYGKKGPLVILPVGEAYLTWVFIAGAIESFIIMALNRDFMRWLRYRFLLAIGKDASNSSNSPHNSPRASEQEEGVPMKEKSAELSLSKTPVLSDCQNDV
eukprot:TRINITY_DN8868_c0_g1_i1.p1 TRINITY_DN8868_c0_g1~~TRINITY_DN8868_c0_g1_i1.p1  ORF type:complete len:363 (-),score=46.55 TRINITY_DN8868_c0_g1_i1:91-1179(-)